MKVKGENLKEADGVVAGTHSAEDIEKNSESCYTKDGLFVDYLGNDVPCYVAINNFETKDGI